ncbi:transglutaminase-like cysteine peptidase [Bradyrhizobium sp. RDM12]
MLPFFRKVALAVAGLMVGLEAVNAGWQDMPQLATLPHVRFEAPTLPPMAYTRFCLRYPDECRARPMFRGTLVRLTTERWTILKQINQTVNRSIIPDLAESSSGVEAWLINPDRAIALITQ